MPELLDFDRLFNQVFGPGTPAAPRDLIGMDDAVTEACLRMGRNSKATESERNAMAEVLSRRLELYAIGDERNATRRLKSHELLGGRFVEGGATLAFRDQRAPIHGLAVSRTALDGAIRTLTAGR